MNVNAVFATLFLSILLTPGAIFAKGRGGGGGDAGGGGPIALEFLAVLDLALKEMKASSPQLYAQLEAAGVNKDVIERIDVIENRELTLTVNGQTRHFTALNYPSSGLIELHQRRWSSILSLDVKAALALHEVASLKRLERTGVYTYSGKYLASKGLTLRSLIRAQEAILFAPVNLCGEKIDGRLIERAGNFKLYLELTLHNKPRSELTSFCYVPKTELIWEADSLFFIYDFKGITHYVLINAFTENRSDRLTRDLKQNFFGSKLKSAEVLIRSGSESSEEFELIFSDQSPRRKFNLRDYP